MLQKCYKNSRLKQNPCVLSKNGQDQNIVDFFEMNNFTS